VLIRPQAGHRLRFHIDAAPVAASLIDSDGFIMHTLPLTRTGLTLLAAGLLAACGPKPDGKPAMGNLPPPPEVGVMTVATAPLELTTELAGRLQSVRSAQVRARVEGVVQKILFIEGSDVKAGAPLLIIDPRTYQAAAEAARAEASTAEQSLARNLSLLQVKAVSQQDVDAAQARQKQAKAALAKAELDLENAAVQAPISGRIGHALVTEGALVGRGDSTPLALIEQLDPIYVNITQSESEQFALRQAIRRGEVSASQQLRVDLVQADGTLYPHSGKLTVTEKSVDPNTGTVFLRAEVPNPRHELMPGSYVRVRLAQARMDSAIAVPQRAVQMNTSGPYVLVVGDDEKVAPVSIQTGAMSGDQWVVKSGLKPGMRVVVDGLQKARPGSQVKPVSSPAK
jgi:membrane fusion protein (multidrug efflux system)